MTAACLTLLHRAGRPMWPWTSAGPGLLVEAFPAAQLCAWNLPHERYDGPSSVAVAVRATILAGLPTGLELGSWGATLEGSADALDAVLCAFAAIVVSTLPPPVGQAAATEGCIAVHP